MFPIRPFPDLYFARQYFPAPPTGDGGPYFEHQYFPTGYFEPFYFPPSTLPAQNHSGNARPPAL